MPFVQAKCENCGGVLQVEASLKAAICPYCGTPYVVQDAVNNYITNTNIERVHADVLNITDDSSANARLTAANAFMQLRKYDDARKAFAEVSALTPQDYRGWWGQVCAITHSFTKKLENKGELENIHLLYESALVFAPIQEKRNLEQKFFAYYRPLCESNDQQSNELRERIENLNCEIVELQASISEFTRKTIRYLYRSPNPFGCITWAAYGLSCIIVLLGIVGALIIKEVELVSYACMPLVFVVIWQNVVLRFIKHVLDAKEHNIYQLKWEKEKQLGRVINQLHDAERQYYELTH